MSGTVTPDASWADTGSYSHDGQWTPDTDWVAVPLNSRYYPMNKQENGISDVLKDVYQPDGSNDGQIINYDPDAWKRG